MTNSKYCVEPTSGLGQLIFEESWEGRASDASVHLAGDLGLQSDRTGVLSSVLFARGQSDLPAKALFVLFFRVPGTRLSDFDAWFRTEHARMLQADPGWMRTSLYAPDEGFARAAVHALSDMQVLESPSRATAGATKWTSRITSAEWWEKPATGVFDAAAAS